MNLTIRRAEASDMGAVWHLIKELAVFEREPHAVEVTVDDLIAYGTGENPEFTCFVAVDKEEIVGIALIYYRFSTWKGRTIHLEDLIVKQDRRGEGIGLALYKEVIRYGYKQGVRRVEWVVLDWNHDAIRFYERSGAKVLKDWHTVQMDAAGIENFVKEHTANGGI